MTLSASEDWLTIRRAQPSDAEAVIAGINEICQEGGGFFANKYIPTPQWEGVLRYPLTVPNHLLAVVEKKGQFVGAGRLFPGFSGSVFSHVVDLGMFILKPYRRHGIGSELLNWMLKWASDYGFEKVTLSVLATNWSAIQLYKKFGFIQEGRLYKQGKQNEKYFDLIKMSYFFID
jgi:ribosomal protein S18 acetylase RimI-like enzyme